MIWFSLEVRETRKTDVVNSIQFSGKKLAIKMVSFGFNLEVIVSGSVLVLISTGGIYLLMELTVKLRVSELNVIACLKPYGLAQSVQGSSKLFYMYI